MVEPVPRAIFSWCRLRNVRKSVDFPYVEDYSERSLTVTFDNSGWYGVVELCFEGLISMNLRPAQENYSREIFSACLFVENECVFWADDALEKEDLNYTGSYIKALNLKWRKIR